MQKIKINNTDLELCTVGMGTVDAGLLWDHEDADRLLETYIAGGGNVIDTAHVYSDWVPGEMARSERVVGDWIRRRGRHDDFVLITKGGHPRNETMNVSRLSKEEMVGDLEDSLLKLGVDCVDIYFYHRDDERRSVKELVETMQDFVRAGKIRYYGCSNWSTARMRAADAYCKEKGYRGFVANQAMYNIGVKHMNLFPDPTMIVCDEEMLQYHTESDNLLIPYMGVCSGFFHRLKSGDESVKEMCYYTDANLKLAEELYALCERENCSITQALMGFFRTREFDCIPLVGMNTAEQMKEAMDTMEKHYVKADYQFC